MLSIFALSNAFQAGSYYEKDNYYAKDSPEAKEASNWTGTGAHALGLFGVVEKEQFKALLEGKLPTGQQLGRMENGNIDHLPGYDLTFSAPKSVSILALVGGDQRILQAHKEAVQADLNYLEKRLAQTRILNEDKIERQSTGNFAIAQFHHDTSRELDPHLHTHNVILNMTQRADGKWRSITGDVLYEHKMLNGLIYRAALAEKLTALGYELEIDHQNGTFEIKGVPQQLIEQFSTRREQIENYLEEKGLEGAKASEVATLATRVAKRDVDRGLLVEEWKQQCVEAGFDAREASFVKREAKENNSEQSSSFYASHLIGSAQQAVAFALNHLSEREAAFSEQDILKESLKAGMGNVLFPHIQRAFEQAKINGALMEASNGKFTTPKALATEQSIIEYMLAGKNAVRAIDESKSFWKLLTAPFLKQPTVEQFLQDKSLTAGQKAAAEMILTTQDRIVGIQGYAGTGKTHMLKAVREYAEQKGFQVVGLSPKASAAKELQEASGISSTTLSQFLAEAEKQQNLSKTEIREPKTLFVLDESSMASNHQLNTFLSLLQKLDARVFLVGDVQQLGAIEAGKPFDQLQKAGMQTTTMQDILRQKNEKLLAAVYDSIKGDIKQAMQKLDGSIIKISNKSDRLKSLADAYLKLSTTERDKTLILAPANVDRIELNKLIREGLKQKGQLMGNETTASILINKGLTRAQRIDLKCYETGDVIRLNQKIKIPTHHLQKNEYYTVHHIDPKTNTLTFIDKTGNTLHWQPNKGGSKSGIIEVYKQEHRNLMVGDIIGWTRNDKTQRIRNSETAQIKSIKDGKALLQLENGKTFALELNNKAHQHWDHGYASTVHAAQGKTCDRVLVHADSTNKHLTHQRSFYVELSRAKHEARFFTDNKAQLLKTIEKYTGEKTSALEMACQFGLTTHKEQHPSKGMEVSL